MDLSSSLRNVFFLLNLGPGLLDVFFQVLPDFFCEKTGKQESQGDDPDLQKDMMNDIFLEPLNQGCHKHRNAIETR